MLSNLLVTLQHWAYTPVGAATLAIIFVLGLVLAFLIVVVANNLYSELKAYHKKYDKDVKALKDQLETNRKSFEGESQKSAETIAQLNKSNEHVKVLLQESENKVALNDDMINTLREERDHLKQDYLTSLNNELSSGRALYGIGRMLMNIIKSKSCTARTYLVGSGLNDDNEPVVLFKNVTDEAALVNSNISLQTQAFDFCMVADRDFVQGNDSYTSLQQAANAFYHESLSSLDTIGPMHYVSILHIRPLNMKLVITDVNLFADIQINETKLSKDVEVLRSSVIKHIQNSIRSGEDYIILTPDVASSLGYEFENASLFNTDWLIKNRPINIAQAS